jgi:hypothetical protein
MAPATSAPPTPAQEQEPLAEWELQLLAEEEEERRRKEIEEEERKRMR